MILWRPVGIKELQLIYETGMKAFPARLPEQPIFYPVTNEAYACQIAKDWNAGSKKGCGYVLRFEISDSYVQQFDKQVVGGSIHEELWVPAEVLPAFNAQIEDSIVLMRAFFQSGFGGYAEPVPAFGGLHEALHQSDPDEQLKGLEALWGKGKLKEVVVQYNKLIFLHYAYWVNANVSPQAQTVLAKVGELWADEFSFSLCTAAEVFWSV